MTQQPCFGGDGTAERCKDSTEGQRVKSRARQEPRAVTSSLYLLCCPRLSDSLSLLQSRLVAGKCPHVPATMEGRIKS